MNLLIFGGSGFVGQHLASYFEHKGMNVFVASRKKRRLGAGRCVVYDTTRLPALLDELQPHAVINLAGESIQSGRWTAKRKHRIRTSRIRLTRTLVAAIADAVHKPDVLINASAVGYYGYSEQDVFTEESSAGNGFLPDVTHQWETEAWGAQAHTRVVIARLGVVLGKNEGAFPKMILPYQFLMGGRVGSGRQWVSWVHIDDVCRIVDFILQQPVQGPVNVTAPHPVTMDTFGRTIADVMKRPHWFPVPAFVLKTVMGDVSEILLKGQKVLPHSIQSYGFSFTYPKLRPALEDLL